MTDPQQPVVKFVYYEGLYIDGHGPYALADTPTIECVSNDDFYGYAMNIQLMTEDFTIEGKYDSAEQERLMAEVRDGIAKRERAKRRWWRR